MSHSTEYSMEYRGVDWGTLPDEVQNLINEIVEKITFQILEDAQTKIREYDLIDTGNLLNSITPIFYEEDGKTVGVVFVAAEYGIYHEIGTVNLPAKPFLYPAVIDAQIDFIEAIKQVLESLKP